MFKILERVMLTPNICKMVVSAPRIAEAAKPGQFLIVRSDEKGERIPLTISDYDRENGTVTIVPQLIGASSAAIISKAEGEFFSDVVGPLGNPSAFVDKTNEDLKGQRYIFIAGGGGTASFDDGLPMFSAAAMGLLATKGLTPDKYIINSAMDGRQYIYGAQLGLSYKINDWLSVFAGGRMNYFSGGYEGFLDAKLIPELGGSQLANIELDCDQTGWGLTPIIGADVKFGKWNFAAKYEFKTNMNIENKTHKIDVNPVEAEPLLAPYKDGVNTPSDIPSLLTIAAGYEILPTLRASVEYHFYDDKSAGMAEGRQKYLTKGANEYLAGIEWDATKQLTISGGYHNADYGLSNNFQTDTSFYCDSYSLGFGAKIKMNSHLNLNIAYFWTTYDDYTKTSENYNNTTIKGTDVYARTNKVFGLSVDYHF